MAVYLKKFSTSAEYETYINGSGAILPNVSVCEDAPTTVHYNPLSPVPPTPTHDYVEIGGLKWATMNVGADSITDTGLYFQWGDTQGYTAEQVGSGEGQKYFDWPDYKYGNGTSSPGATGMTKYTCSGSSGSGSGSGSDIEGDGLCELQPSDDAVTAAWGDQWRMPTLEEYVALGDAVNTAWTVDYQGSGVSGMVCTDKIDSSKVLFFPAAGRCDNGSVGYVGSYGDYWSSSLNTNDVVGGHSLGFSSGDVGWQTSDARCLGFSVRGIMKQYVVAKFNVTDTSSPTRIIGELADSPFSTMEIDGVEQPNVVSVYTFSTIGEHTVKYALTDSRRIGNNVFNGCSSLTSIDIPNSVTSIGWRAFSGCSSLTSIDIPNSVTSIEDHSFRDCSSLTSCTIGSGVTMISIDAFSYCTSLTSIVCNATTAPTITMSTFQAVKTGGTLYVPIGSSGYNVWMSTGDYYLGKYGWTKVEQ